MKTINVILFVSFLLSVVLGAEYIYNMKIVFSCSGVYSASNMSDSQHTSNIYNILVTVRKSREIEVNITGLLTVSGEAYHVDREYIFNYRAKNINAGMIKLTQSNMIKGNSDRVKERDSERIFPALQRKDAIIRIWQFSPETLLIGNAFTPMFSCNQIP